MTPVAGQSFFATYFHSLLASSRPFQHWHALRSLRTRMQSAISETESKSLDLSICVHHYTLRAPCPKGQGTTENLHDCQIVSQLSASNGSRFPSAFVVRTGNQGLAKRLGASPNRPVWSGAAVQAPKEGRSREATTRCIKGLENVNRSIYRPSQPGHTLVLERIPATSAPSVQTAKRCHVRLFGRLEPLVETL